MAGKGGARPGAGRKPKAVKYQAPINKAERQIVDRLPGLVETLVILATDGMPVIRRKYVPAGTVTIGSGELMQLVYPDKPADELVLIEELHEQTTPDRAAGQYLIDRILGKTTARIEAEVEQSGALTIRVEYDDEGDQTGAAPSGSSAG